MVLTGPLCSGKTTLAGVLAAARGAQIVSAREELMRLGAIENRRDLQSFGPAIERRTGGVWLASAVAALEGELTPAIVDSARTSKQIDALRAIRPQAVVVYLTASRHERKRRYESRDDPADQSRSFESALSGELGEIADLDAHAEVRVDTDAETPQDVASYVLSHVDLGPG